MSLQTTTDKQQLDRDLQALTDAIAAAEQGERKVVQLHGPARPVLSRLLDNGALERALLMLERDGSEPRIAVHPRTHSGPPTVSELLQEDHRRLDAIAEEMVALARTDPTRALKLAQIFAEGLQRHIRIEEDILFPEFEAHTGMKHGGPTFVMRNEHREIERHLTTVLNTVQKLADTGPDTQLLDTLSQSFSDLVDVLSPHNVKEEQVLYPMSDRALGAKGLPQVLQRIVLF